MMKKSQGMPIRVIIIAAIGLIVLFIVVTMVSKRSASFDKTVNSCESNEGNCLEKCGPEETSVAFDCKEENTRCCINPRDFK